MPAFLRHLMRADQAHGMAEGAGQIHGLMFEASAIALASIQSDDDGDHGPTWMNTGLE